MGPKSHGSFPYVSGFMGQVLIAPYLCGEAGWQEVE